MRRACLAVLLSLGATCHPNLPLPIAPNASPEEVAPDSPRGSMSEFMRLTNKGNFADATRYLDLAPAQAAEGAALASELRTVLDYRLEVDPEELSPLPGGDVPQGQPQIVTLGLIPMDAHREPVRIVRKEDGDNSRWVFSRATVGRVEAWYERLPDNWTREDLPPILLQRAPLGLFWWQLIGLPLLVLASAVGGLLLRWVTTLLLRPVLSGTAGQLGVELLERIGGPLGLAYALLVASVLLERLALPLSAEGLLQKALGLVEFVILFWGALRALDVFVLAVEAKLGDPGARSLLAVLGRAGKMAVVALFAVMVLATFGVPVTSVIAGVGIGGLGLALAAQKTVENLFGSFSLAADRAIRVGDDVQIDQLVGTVESIGLRSTRIRTGDRTVVTVPNGKLADVRIESVTARDRCRLQCLLPLRFGTSAETVRRILQGIDAAIRAQESLNAPDLVVSLREIGPASLNVEVNATFAVPFGDFRLIRQGLLLQFIEIVEREGSALALPTQSVRIDQPPKEPAQGAS
jgi:MscS family membrane protein